MEIQLNPVPLFSQSMLKRRDSHWIYPSYYFFIIVLGGKVDGLYSGGRSSQHFGGIMLGISCKNYIKTFPYLFYNRGRSFANNSTELYYLELLFISSKGEGEPTPYPK